MNTPPQKTKTEMNRLHITQSRSDVDIEDFIYLDSLQMELAKSDLYVEHKQAIKMLRHALHEQYIQFENSANQAFVKEVFSYNGGSFSISKGICLRVHFLQPIIMLEFCLSLMQLWNMCYQKLAKKINS